MMVEWNPLKYKAPEGFELVGDFHTHPYTPKEVKKWQKTIPTFTGQGVGFDTQDILGTTQYLKKDYVSIVVSGDTTFGFVVTDAELAKKFTENKEHGAAAIDEAIGNLDWDFAEGKVSGNYEELSWDTLKKVVENYKTGTGKDAGIEFFRIKK